MLAALWQPAHTVFSLYCLRELKWHDLFPQAPVGLFPPQPCAKGWSCWLSCRNQASATAAVQAAAQAQQQPQLSSLLVEPSWQQVLGPEFDKPYMQQLQGFLEQEWGSQIIYPPKDSIFRTFNAVPFDQVGAQHAQQA